MAARRASGPEQEQPTIEAPEKPLKPHQCRGYMRQNLAEHFPEIVAGFVKEAKTGSCPHVKLASELLEKPVRTGRRGKGSAELMLEKFREEGIGVRDQG